MCSSHTRSVTHMVDRLSPLLLACHALWRLKTQQRREQRDYCTRSLAPLLALVTWPSGLPLRCELDVTRIYICVKGPALDVGNYITSKRDTSPSDHSREVRKQRLLVASFGKYFHSTLHSWSCCTWRLHCMARQLSEKATRRLPRQA